MNGSYLVTLYTGYFAWHYGRGIKDSLIVAGNLIWFISNFFSIPLLFKTLFAPWKRVTENHERGTGLEDYFATIAVNVMSRLVGALIRLAVVFIGLGTLATAFLITIIFYIVWFTAPLLLPLMFFAGFLLIF